MRIILTVAFAVIGLASSLMIAWLHAHVAPDQIGGCGILVFGDCEAVLNSGYSYFLGVPVGWLGVSYFLCVLGCTGYSGRSPGKLADASLLPMVVVGCGISAWFVSVLVSAGLFCFWCSLTHLANAGLLGTQLTKYEPTGPLPQDLRRRLMLAFALGAFAFCVMAILHDPDVRFVEADLVPEQILDGPMDQHLPGLAESQSMGVLELEVERPNRPLTVFGTGELEVMVFADPTCKKCAQLFAMLEQIEDENPDRMRVVLHFFPADRDCNPAIKEQQPEHIGSCHCARLAYYLASQSRQTFESWYLRTVHLDHHSSNQVFRIAQDLAGEVPSKDRLATVSINDQLQRDLDLGIDLGVRVLPTIIVQGRKYAGCPERLDTLRKVLFGP